MSIRHVRWLLLSLVLLGCDDGGSSSDPADAGSRTDASTGDAAMQADTGGCESGSDGCECALDGTCNADLSCVMGRCEPAAPDDCDPATSRCVPVNPVCYTPCRADVVGPDGTLRRCDGDGLMVGCLSGAVCDRGSCVPAEAPKADPAPGTCEVESDCPSFQTCIQGRCYSNCGDFIACQNPLETCFEHVCRRTCDDETPCPNRRSVCDDGTCLPQPQAGAAADEPVGVAYSITPDAVRLNSYVNTGGFTVTNDGVVDVTVTVAVVQHTVVDEAGSSTVVTDRPLPWLRLNGEAGSTQITVAAGGSAEIELTGTTDLRRWAGRLAITASGGPEHELRIFYNETVAGRWVGTAYAFGTFGDGADMLTGDYPLDDWRADRANSNRLGDVPNAFMQAWGRFRKGELALDRMKALIESTITGSWDFPRVRQMCAESEGAGAVCAPFGGVGGAAVISYTSDAIERPVPSGVIEMDFALNLRNAPAGTEGCGEGDCLVGRIDSATALQYGGDPAVVLSFEGDALDCEGPGSGCRALVNHLEAVISVGGRAAPTNGVCPADFTLVSTPWLVPGFVPPVGGTLNEATFERHVEDCRDTRLPFGDAAQNQAFAAANPIPNATPRRRTLELVDGLLYDQTTLMLVLRETVDAFHGGAEGLPRYLLVSLQRQPDALTMDETQGNAPIEVATDAASPAIGCSDALVDGVAPGQSLASLDSAGRDALAQLVVEGRTGAATPIETPVHTLCVWAEEQVVVGLDANAEDSAQTNMVQRQVAGAGPDGSQPCQPGARIYYYTGIESLDEHECNQTIPESCLDRLAVEAERSDTLLISAEARTLRQMRGIDPAVFQLGYRCAEAADVTCDNNRYDLTRGKLFEQLEGQIQGAPLTAEIARAFAYKSRFINRAETGGVGFTPALCSTGAPYCYDPQKIEAARDRVDCALALYHGDAALSANTAALLRTFLRKSFSTLQPTARSSDVILGLGFERLLAELQIMLGDEAYTDSFAARFDLAGAAQLAFEGTAFETDGIDLSGAFGFEMYRLHQAAQTYDLVLDRFYQLSVWMWADLSANESYVTPATVTTYLDRVILASTQRARVWGEIAARYEALNMGELALEVARRTYTRTYQESLVLSAFIARVADAVQGEAGQAEVDRALAATQLKYRSVLVDVKQRYQTLASRTDVFGLPPEFIPFPALNEDDVNGFEVMLDRAKDRLETAAGSEQEAIDSRRDFDTDAETFQGELVTLKATYEAELGAICGTFIGTDGRTYPALAQYAHLSEVLRGFDDPCAANGNGSLYLSGADLQTRQLELQRVTQEIQNALAEVEDTKGLIADQCALIREDVEAFLEVENATSGLALAIDVMGATMTQLDKAHEQVTEVVDRFVELSDSTSWAELFTRIGTTATLAASAVVNFVATSALEAAIVGNQEAIRNLERTYEEFQIGRQCDYLQAEGAATIRSQHRGLLLLRMDALNALWNVQVAFAEIQAIANERNRLETEWHETEQLTLSAAAAQTDPNIRLFKNDAIRGAEHDFKRARQAAWALTRSYEFYTATSYADRERLFLAQLVNYGDANLRRYIDDLEDAFFAFEQEFGNPDTRVARLSLRDDLFDITRYGADNKVLTQQERVDLLRERLLDPSLRDDNGAIVVNFATRFDQLSPRTSNHKILFIEVEFFGSDLGDDVARVYLKQEGTGVVRGTDGAQRYFTFPPRTAVMNPFFDGNRAFGQDADGAISGPTRSVYRSYRFRERPVVQSHWSLTIDRLNERVNQDLELTSLNDIVLYIYYTDFTGE